MATIYYARVGEDWRKEAKYDFLAEKRCVSGVDWHVLNPDARHTWLTGDLESDFEDFMPMGARTTKGEENSETIFRTFSLGVSTNRDSVVYDFNRKALEDRGRQFSDDYNAEVARYQQKGRPVNIDDFVDYSKVKWSSTLKERLRRGTLAQFREENIRVSSYRPFTKMHLYYDSVLTDRPALFRYILPNVETENENRIIWLKVGASWPMFAIVVNALPNLLPEGGSQCFPYYTYDENGENRRENITDWALAQFREHYLAPSPPHPLSPSPASPLTKWDIFHYIYALLHHPDYRETYAANLKRDLPRIPFAPEFWPFVFAGQKLAELHVHYEDQPQYPLQWIESPDAPLSYCVEKLRLSPDKTQIVVNDFLTLAGIPPEAFEYRLGNRSALDWIIDRYRVTKDERSGIINDPNRAADPQYIVRLIGQVVTVSVETVKIVKGLPGLKLKESQG